MSTHDNTKPIRFAEVIELMEMEMLREGNVDPD